MIKKYLNRLFIDGLSGMAYGLFSTLIIGTIICQIGSLIGQIPGAAAVSARLLGAVVVALDLDGMGRVWYNVGAGKKSRTARKKSRNTPVLPTGKRPRSKERPGAFLFSQASRADGYPRREIPEPLPEAERWGTDAGHGRGRDNCKISRRRTLPRSSRVYPPIAHMLECGKNISIKDFPEI